ncbi:MAG: tripartite tricarboxylate transporter substrate binding protein [Clostridia bacterium]
MKKVLTLVLALMLVVSIVGCGNTSTSPEPSTTPSASEGQGSANDTPAKSAASDWPKKPIQVIVPYNPGGDSDFNARAYAKRLEKELGQPVVVSNMAGNGGAVGSRQVKESDPDGYTVLAYHVSMFVNQAVGATDYGLEAFELACISGRNGGSVVTVNANSPYKTLKDLMDASAAKPDELTFAANIGASTSVMASSFNRAGGAFNLVDMGDASERVSALMGGHIDVIPNALGTAIPYIDSGDFRALAIIEDERNPLYPDLPTAIEQGYEGASLPIFYFFAFPDGTPKEIVDKFAAAVEKVNKIPDYQNEIKTAFLQTPYFAKGEEAQNILEKQQEEILAMKEDLLKVKKQ